MRSAKEILREFEDDDDLYVTEEWIESIQAHAFLAGAEAMRREAWKQCEAMAELLVSTKEGQESSPIMAMSRVGERIAAIDAEKLTTS